MHWFITAVCGQMGDINKAGNDVKPEHEVYIGNYPVKFREGDIKDLFEDYDITVGDIRMKHEGWKA